mgnify:CR=1 FL=1|jgi:hypothetical protein
MPDEPALSIVVPVHNSHATIGLLVKEVAVVSTLNDVPCSRGGPSSNW